MKKLFKKISKQNAADLRGELVRAHIVIALLSVIGIFLLGLGAATDVTFDYTLSVIAGVFLAMLATISAGMAYYLSNIKK